jgi:predicted TIM-barrel enzyme
VALGVRSVVGSVPVFCGTGCKAETVAGKLAVSDGAFVGTTFKANGDFKNHIDPERVKKFMEQVELYRGRN